MRNLAGDRDCDVKIRGELQHAGIEIVELGKPQNREVPASVDGKLGEFSFHRAWYYWIFHGAVTLEVAKELYADPVGKEGVRVAGHCGCPPPEEWAFPMDDVLIPQLKRLGKMDITFGDLAKLCNEGVIEGRRFVTTYHIDTEEGLRLFADTLKKHGLV